MGFPTDTCTGTLGTDAIEFRLVGLLHDERADGKGTVGLTFMTTDSRAIPTHPMNTNCSTLGGWRDSLLRRNLNSGASGPGRPPLSGRTLPGVKTTNNGDRYTYTASVTVDRMWLFDSPELWEYSSSKDRPSVQYEFFRGKADSSIYAALKSSNVKAPDSWRWLRGPSNGNSDLFGYVGSDGNNYYVVANIGRGVVPGFTFQPRSPRVLTATVRWFSRPRNGFGRR